MEITLRWLHFWKCHFLPFPSYPHWCLASERQAEIENWERAQLPDLSCPRPLQTAKFPAVVSAVVKPRLENCLCPRDQRHIRIDLLQRQLHFTNGGENNWSPPSRYRASCHQKKILDEHTIPQGARSEHLTLGNQRILPTFSGLLEIVGGQPPQRFFGTWGLWVVVVGCASMVTSCDLQNAAVSFQAELQSIWCHLWNLCTSDSGFTSVLCHGNMQLRTVGSAHFCAPPHWKCWYLNLTVVYCCQLWVS